MGHAVLWISSLVAAVLLVALAAALESLREKRRDQIVGTIALALLPLAAGGLATYFAARLGASGVRQRWLGYCLSWTIIFAAAATVIVVFGMRRGKDAEPLPRARRWPWRTLGAGLAAAFAIWVVTLLYMDSVVRLELVDLRAETRTLALSLAPPRVPDGDNAASEYRHAFEAMGDPQPEFGRLGDWRSPAFNVTSAEVERLLHKRSPVIELLHRAASMPGYRPEADYSRPLSMGLPNLIEWRNASSLLVLDGRNRAAKGDIEGATEDIAAILGMASHLGSYPGLPPCMIAVSLDGDGWRLVEDVLAVAPGGAGVLRELHLRPCLSLRDRYYRAGLMDEAYVLSWFALNYDPRGAATNRIPLESTIRRVYLFHADVASYRGQALSLRLLACKPFYEAREETEELRARLEEEIGGPISAIANRDLSASEVSVAYTEALQRLGSLGIAAAEFRGDRGAFPETPGELVPDYISAVPVDPFDGKPLRMVAEGDGVVLYSVGPDGEDDGGDDKGIWFHGCVAPEGDVIFCLGAAYEERRLKPAREAAERRKARGPRRRRKVKKAE